MLEFHPRTWIKIDKTNKTMMFCFEMLRRVTHCGVFLHFGGDLKLLQHMLVPAEKPAPQEASRHVATWT